jgi:hypothetical protein
MHGTFASCVEEVAAVAAVAAAAVAVAWAPRQSQSKVVEGCPGRVVAGGTAVELASPPVSPGGDFRGPSPPGK